MNATNQYYCHSKHRLGVHCEKFTLHHIPTLSCLSCLLCWRPISTISLLCEHPPSLSLSLLLHLLALQYVCLHRTKVTKNTILQFSPDSLSPLLQITFSDIDFFSILKFLYIENCVSDSEKKTTLNSTILL